MKSVTILAFFSLNSFLIWYQTIKTVNGTLIWSMNQTLSKSLISTTNFYSHYERFMTGSSKDDRTEFFDVCGKQHYWLLSYLSTLYDSETITDIGQSALALSYNPKNFIHTFDVESRVTNESIKSVSNINFHWDNLFEEEGKAKWSRICIVTLTQKGKGARRLTESNVNYNSG